MANKFQQLPDKPKATQNVNNFQRTRQVYSHFANITETARCIKNYERLMNLILEPQKICMTICSFRGSLPNCENKFEVMRQLNELLKISLSAIGLTAVESLNYLNQAKRMNFYTLLEICQHQNNKPSSKGWNMWCKNYRHPRSLRLQLLVKFLR